MKAFKILNRESLSREILLKLLFAKVYPVIIFVTSSLKKVIAAYEPTLYTNLSRNFSTRLGIINLPSLDSFNDIDLLVEV